MPNQHSQVNPTGPQKKTRGIVKRVPIAPIIRDLRQTIGRLNLKVSGLQKELEQREPVVPAITWPIQAAHLEKPKFDGTTKIHPVTFIEDLKTYIERTPHQGHIIEEVVNCLEGEARNWARIYKSRWANFTHFQEDFLNTYWSETEQSALRRKIICGKWSPSKRETMLNYFLTLAGQAKMLIPTPPEIQLVEDILRHFPKDVQYMWVLKRGTSIIEAADFLRKFDAIATQGEVAEVAGTEKPNWNNHNTRRFPQNTSDRRNIPATITSKSKAINAIDDIVELGDRSENLN